MTQPWGSPNNQNRQAGSPWGGAPQNGRGGGPQNGWGAPQGNPWGGAPQRNGWGGQRATFGQQQWGQQFGSPQQFQRGMQFQTPMPGGFGRPPRRRNPILRLLRALVTLAVLGFVGLVALGMFASRVATSTTPTTTGPTTTQPTSWATAEQTTPEQTTSGAATSDTTGGEQTGGTSTGQVPDQGSYQNESYQVPPPDLNPPALPEPETYEEATQLLRANPVYQASVPRPVRCEMGTLNLQTASKTQLTTHLNEMMACLMRVWEPPLKAAGFTAVRPSVTVYTGELSTKCGKLPARNASYCGADQQVYYAMDLPQVIPTSLRSSRYVTESVVAHEFGHAVQARTAILVSEMAWEEKSSKSDGLALSRRLEMQADCFAGEFLGSIQQSTQMTQPELSNIGRLFYSIGDDVLTGNPSYVGNHGHGADRQAWITAGLGSTKVGTCNTFTAPASSVR